MELKLISQPIFEEGAENFEYSGPTLGQILQESCDILKNKKPRVIKEFMKKLCDIIAEGEEYTAEDYDRICELDALAMKELRAEELGYIKPTETSVIEETLLPIQEQVLRTLCDEIKHAHNSEHAAKIVENFDGSKYNFNAKQQEIFDNKLLESLALYRFNEMNINKLGINPDGTGLSTEEKEAMKESIDITTIYAEGKATEENTITDDDGATWYVPNMSVKVSNKKLNAYYGKKELEKITDMYDFIHGHTDLSPDTVLSDLSEVDFDTENCDFYENKLYRKDDVYYLLGTAGGDWEVPLIFVVYWDGENYRGYIPKRGNAVNLANMSAFGNDKELELKILKRIFDIECEEDDIVDCLTCSVKACQEEFESLLE